MKEKLEYNFLHIIPLYFKFYYCFYSVTPKVVTFFVITSVAILSEVDKIKKKKVLESLHFVSPPFSPQKSSND